MFYQKDIERGSADDGDNHHQPLLQLPVNNDNNALQSLCGILPGIPKEVLHERITKLTIPLSTRSSPGSTPPSTANTPMPRKFRRSDRRQRRLNTELLEAIENNDFEVFERLLTTGANPNATCRQDLVSASHIAALQGGDFLDLLIKTGAERHRLDRLGRTPLHLAAWAGNARQMAVLLDFPEEMLKSVERDDMSSEAEDDVRKLCDKTRRLANIGCNIDEVNTLLPKEWKDNIDHNCREIKGTLPLIQSGWTPLHVASACAKRHCTRLLLASGADVNKPDDVGRTPLDVAGAGFYYEQEINSKHFTEVIQLLINSGAKHNTMKADGLDNMATTLHTAVELESTDAVKLLLDHGVFVSCLNADGQTPLHLCVEKKAEELLQILSNSSNDNDPFSATIDVKDREGHTVLQAAVRAAWVEGVCVSLEAGADVTIKALDGETPLHSAASLGNVDVLNEILSVAKQKDYIDCQNASGETPLFIAVKCGHLDCVESILNEGSSLRITLPGDITIFHKASEYGRLDILKLIVEHSEKVTMDLINDVSLSEGSGLGPIHFATLNNHPKCVEYLLSKGADVRLRTTRSPFLESTPLHLAARKNYNEIANAILKFDKTTIHEVNSYGWFPLHVAAHHGSREIIPLLLQAGGDLAGYSDGPKKYRRTAIDMIINNLSKPTEFLEEIFDSYITTNNQNLMDIDCAVTLDFSSLMPKSCEIEQMKVIEALLKTGNRSGQKRLLVHPLIESFLYLKWKALCPFFYMILACFAVFVLSLTVFIVSVYFWKDVYADVPWFLNSDVWGGILYFTIAIILLQELLYMNLVSKTYFLQLETWVKFGSLILASTLPPTISDSSLSEAEWPRHVATIAVLLSWIEMMFLLSRFPNWGYFVLMFGKVATNVVKILLTFSFLVIGFSLSFMIQFRSQIPFEGPWAALVKTIVMMTSEFDYNSLFNEENIKNLSTSIIVLRIIFLIFLILAAIVLMNLMVGVAVNDINDLETLGNIRRLAKQVEFLSTLDTLVYNKVYSKFLPRKLNSRVRDKRNVANMMEIFPSRPKWRHTKILPERLREAIFNKATEHNRQLVKDTALQEYSKKINEIHNILIKQNEKANERAEYKKKIESNERPRFLNRNDEVVKQIAQLEENVNGINNKLESLVTPPNSVDINTKMEELSAEILGIKHFLTKLESRLDKI